jgi:ribose 5-phosphate isomerase B
MKLAIASDHGGFSLKESLIQSLKEKKIDVIDLGNHGTESVDYPDYAIKVAEMVSEGKVEAGLLMCGTGIGMCIVANKFKNVRAAVVSDAYSARMAKEHNNANILCIGGRVVDPKKGEEIVRAWLTANFEGGRHDRRLDKIREIEKKNLK